MIGIAYNDSDISKLYKSNGFTVINYPLLVLVTITTKYGC